MKFISKKDNPQQFLQYWQQFLEKHRVTFRYLPIFMQYMLAYAASELNDQSFVTIENNQCEGICFLPIKTHSDVVSVSLAGGYSIAPLCSNERIEKKVFEKIELLAKELRVQCIKFYIDPLILEYQNKYNYLQKYNFVESSTSDCLIDLKLNQEELWRNLRKSYKPLINGILKNQDFKIVLMDSQNASYSLHEQYRQLHRKAAGRITRSKETFDKQFAMLQNDQASLLGLQYKDVFIGFNYFLHFQKTVVYASGADDPEYENNNFAVYHAILWSAILYYKQRQFEYIRRRTDSSYWQRLMFIEY